MGKRRSAGASGGSRPSAGPEWVGGVVAASARATADGAPYQFETLLWAGPQGQILGVEVGEPGEVIGLACESLQRAIETPLSGQPHAPSRVRVASEILAEALCRGQLAIEIVCAPTPELDDLQADLAAELAVRDCDEEPYFLALIEPEVAAAFCRAALDLYRARPWEVVSSGPRLFSVQIEDLGVPEAVLSMMGQPGDSFGLLLFREFADFEAYVDGARPPGEAMEQLPPYLFLNFESADDTPLPLLCEIVDHGWPVADESAYPWLGVVDARQELPRQPTGREVAVAEALARALPRVLRNPQALHAAWEGGAPVSRSVSVGTHVGEVEVTLRVPCPHTGPAPGR